MKWHYKTSDIPQSFDDFKDILIKNRGITDEREFFKPSSPLKLTIHDVKIDQTQFDLAISRIKKAITAQEKVAIFGDYDADGICATVIIWEAIKEAGLIAKTFIPDRKKHGYGISKQAVEEIIGTDKPNLIITVDNGIVAHEAIEWTVNQGVDVIVSDHHQAEDNLPNATAIVHTSAVCGAGVAWMIAKEINPPGASKSLDLVAIATVADLVPLSGANRDFVIFGLNLLNKTDRLGLKSLINVSNLGKKKLTSRSIGYGLGPRINAMGRLQDANEAVTLLSTTDDNEASEIADLLEKTNQLRRNLTIDLVKLAHKQSDIKPEDKLIIVWNKEYHEGVVGLIAGRLVERYSKPAIVINLGDEVSKASARSLSGVNIIELIRQVKDDLIAAGGHPMAAGFSFETKKLENIVTRLKDLASEQIDADLLTSSIYIDCQLPMSLATEKVIDKLDDFEPFGKDNPQPTISLHGLEIKKIFVMGANKQHIKIIASEKDSNSYMKIDCIAWNRPDFIEKFSVNDFIDVVGKLEINEWNGRRNVQLLCKDIIFSA